VYLHVCVFCFAHDTYSIHTSTSPVYCYGPLLDTLQRRGLFPSKQLVDMSLKFDPSTVLDNFSQLPVSPTDEQLRQFVTDNFNSTPDLVNWQPPDWVER